MPILTNVTKLANKIKVRSSNVCWSSDSNLQHTTKHISKDTHNSSYPAQSSGLSWQNGYFCLFHYTTLSEMPFFVLNRVRVLKTSAAHSFYPNSPLVYLQYKKQNYITPGGCSEGVTSKRRENLKTLMLKNGHCHLWRQSFKRVSNQKALTGKRVVVLIDKWRLIIGRWSLMRHCRTWRFNYNHWNKL